MTHWSLKTRATGLVYGSAAGLVSLLFLGLLSQSILSALPEQDLWWMLPTLSHYLDGKPLVEALGFLVSPTPAVLGQPVLKIYLSLISWLGLFTRDLIVVAIGVHAGNAALLYWLTQHLGLPRRVGVCSALVYFTSFAHFHAYLWPTAAQHVFAVFAVLLTLNLYLGAEQRIGRRVPCTWWLVAMWAVAFAASSQQGSVLLAPALILTHILVCSNGRQERIVKLDRWLPYFVACLVYPAIAFTFVGHPKFMALAEFPVPASVKALILFLGGVGCLLVVRRLLRMPTPSWHGRNILPILILSVSAVGLVIFAIIDRRQVLLPYNALVPFITTMTSFLEPIQAALVTDSTEPYHYIAPQISVFNAVLSLLLIGVFVAVFAIKKKPMIIVFVWYMLSVPYLLRYPGFPVRIPSRYFIYLSPVFAIVFCAALVHGYGALVRNTRLKPLSRDIILAGLLLTLCIPNLLAIRLEIFRGKLANTYLIYDDIRTAFLIREDLRQAQNVHREPGAIYVKNVSEMPLLGFLDSLPVDPAKHETFRDIVGEVFRDRGMRAIRVNEVAPSNGDGQMVYVVSDHRIQNTHGVNIELFGRLFEEAVTLMTQNRHQQAMELFKRAIQERPFLLRYVLSGYRLDDVRWITAGFDMRQWVNRIGAQYASWSDKPFPKGEHILTVMNRELSDYVLSIFYLSYLEYRFGHTTEAQWRLSQIQFLERDVDALAMWISKVPVVDADPAMVAFLHGLKNPAYFRDPLPWRVDDYGFPKFLMRLLFNWDIQSIWDRRQSAAGWRSVGEVVRG